MAATKEAIEEILEKPNPNRRERSCPRAVKRARHNQYLVKKPDQKNIAHEHGKHCACVQHGREAIERNHLKVVPARVFARLNEFVQRGSTVYLHGFLIGQYVFHEHAPMSPDLAVRDRA